MNPGCKNKAAEISFCVTGSTAPRMNLKHA